MKIRGRNTFPKKADAELSLRMSRKTPRMHATCRKATEVEPQSASSHEHSFVAQGLECTGHHTDPSGDHQQAAIPKKLKGRASAEYRRTHRWTEVVHSPGKKDPEAATENCDEGESHHHKPGEKNPPKILQTGSTRRLRIDDWNDESRGKKQVSQQRGDVHVAEESHLGPATMNNLPLPGEGVPRLSLDDPEAEAGIAPRQGPFSEKVRRGAACGIIRQSKGSVSSPQPVRPEVESLPFPLTR